MLKNALVAVGVILIHKTLNLDFDNLSRVFNFLDS